MADYKTNKNKFAQDPQRRPPAGWKVDKWFFKSVLVKATRTGHQPLIDRVKQMENSTQHELTLVADIIARAAKGFVDPTSIDIDAILANDIKN